jgi:hypothetical protein
MPRIQEHSHGMTHTRLASPRTKKNGRDVGGLQARSRDGHWIDVSPLAHPGAAVISPEPPLPRYRQ